MTDTDDDEQATRDTTVELTRADLFNELADRRIVDPDTTASGAEGLPSGWKLVVKRGPNAGS